MKTPENRSSAWAWLSLAVISEVIATLCLKAALGLPALYVIVVAGYVLAFVSLARCLDRGMGLGVAYGVWGACGVALTAGLATLIYGEPFTVLMGIGIALIIGGVLLVEFGAQAAHRAIASREVLDGAQSAPLSASTAEFRGGVPTATGEIAIALSDLGAEENNR